MTPEEAVQANLDANALGAFSLAYHSWNVPIERALKEAKKSGVNLIDPLIGETVLLNSDLKVSDSSWWDF